MPAGSALVNLTDYVWMWVRASLVLVQNNDFSFSFFFPLQQVNRKMASVGVEAVAARCPEWEGN